MNRSWDKPTDPYVEIGRYPKVLANFLLRANVAQEHPRDARKLRLIPFQKGNRS
jgi:Centromere-associated protein K